MSPFRDSTNIPLGRYILLKDQIHIYMYMYLQEYLVSHCVLHSLGTNMWSSYIENTTEASWLTNLSECETILMNIASLMSLTSPCMSAARWNVQMRSFSAGWRSAVDNRWVFIVTVLLLYVVWVTDYNGRDGILFVRNGGYISIILHQLMSGKPIRHRSLWHPWLGYSSGLGMGAQRNEKWDPKIGAKL